MSLVREFKIEVSVKVQEHVLYLRQHIADIKDIADVSIGIPPTCILVYLKGKDRYISVSIQDIVTKSLSKYFEQEDQIKVRKKHGKKTND